MLETITLEVTRPETLILKAVDISARLFRMLRVLLLASLQKQVKLVFMDHSSRTYSNI